MYKVPVGSVVDSDLYVFEHPGSGSESVTQRYGSGSFYHQAKIMVRKNLIPTVLYYFLIKSPVSIYNFQCTHIV